MALGKGIKVGVFVPLIYVSELVYYDKVFPVHILRGMSSRVSREPRRGVWRHWSGLLLIDWCQGIAR